MLNRVVIGRVLQPFYINNVNFMVTELDDDESITINLETLCEAEMPKPEFCIEMWKKYTPQCLVQRC